MRLYLDDDIAGPTLAQLLRNARHDVQLPSDAGLAGRSDAEHLAHSIRTRRICLSRNYRDFEHLHLLLREAQGRHPGIIIVRRDDSTRRNLTPRDIVRALRNMEAAGVAQENEYIILNAWQ